MQHPPLQPPTVGRSGRPPLEPPTSNGQNGGSQGPTQGAQPSGRPPLEPPAAAPKVGRAPLQPPQFVPQNRPLGAAGPNRAAAEASDDPQAGAPAGVNGWPVSDQPVDGQADGQATGLPPGSGRRGHSDDTERFFGPGDDHPSAG